MRERDLRVSLARMQIAILLYDHMTALDAIGPYEVLSRLPAAETVFVGERRGEVRCDSRQLALVADAGIDEVENPDILVVPGWSGSRQSSLLNEGPVRDWLRAVDVRTTWTTSVCTGSLVLAAAGLLRHRRATTHWLASDMLTDFGAIPTPGRVVFDGKYVTSAGVSAGIDMALTLTATIAGPDTAKAIQLGIEYDPSPPFDAGSAAKAPAHVVAAMRAIKNFIIFGG
jgi:putative intracellular protease/amidase